jgi:hypothetical protein
VRVGGELGISEAPEPLETYHVGVRHWDVDAANNLTAPYGSGAVWQPGINSARCLVDHGQRRDQSWRDCRCGLYCFRLQDAQRANTYFDLSASESVAGKAIGALAYWHPRQENPRGGEVAAQYAAICALLLPSDRRSERERLLPVAEAYGVRLVPVSELENEAHAWIARQSSTAFGAIACEAPWYHRLFGARQYVPVRAVAA